MSQSEILQELPHLTIRQRREIIEQLLDLEADVETLRDADRRADERFLMLDAMETKDGSGQAG